MAGSNSIYIPPLPKGDIVENRQATGNGKTVSFSAPNRINVFTDRVKIYNLSTTTLQSEKPIIKGVVPILIVKTIINYSLQLPK